MKYSRIQFFFWLISGSEISALKNCPNEYNRHANIGMMILITSSFAFFTAFIAGGTFVEKNVLGVTFFAFIWAILIFAIDRSMVNSIKKDPKIAFMSFWPFFIPRLILAFILAFFMSIPLDHIVFAQRIDRQMKENNKNDWLKQQTDLNMGYHTDLRESEVKTYDKEKKEIEKELLSDCPRQDYKAKVSEYKLLRNQAAANESEYNQALNLVNSMIAKREREQDTIKPRYLPEDIVLFQKRNRAKAEWLSKLSECKSAKSAAEKIDKDWREGKEKDFNKKDSLSNKGLTKLNLDKDTIAKNVAKFKSEIESQNGFDTRFVTLFLMPNWGVQILKWAIFLALLVIEILPTYLKLKTPIGQYDWEVYKRDKIMANDVEQKILFENEISKGTESYRMTKEIDLNEKIITKVAEIELNLANETLNEWEKQARDSMKSNVSSANAQNQV